MPCAVWALTVGSPYWAHVFRCKCGFVIFSATLTVFSHVFVVLSAWQLDLFVSLVCVYLGFLVLFSDADLHCQPSWVILFRFISRSV